MRYARLDSTKSTVIEIISHDPTGFYPKDWTWIKCPDDTKQNASYVFIEDVFDESDPPDIVTPGYYTFVNPEDIEPEPTAPKPTYSTLKDAQLALSGWINSLTGQIKDVYPDVVQQGWEEEEEMAEAFFLDNMSQDQADTLTRDATAKNRTSQEHAQRILDNAQVFRSIKDLTRTLWLKTDRLLAEASDPNDYPIILSAAIEEAKPLAAAYGLIA